jgi:hypothetical protein
MGENSLGPTLKMTTTRAIRGALEAAGVEFVDKKRGGPGVRLPDDAARQVAGNNRRWWRNSAMALNRALPNTLFNRLGVPTLAS